MMLRQVPFSTAALPLHVGTSARVKVIVSPLLRAHESDQYWMTFVLLFFHLKRAWEQIMHASSMISLPNRPTFLFFFFISSFVYIDG